MENNIQKILLETLENAYCYKNMPICKNVKDFRDGEFGLIPKYEAFFAVNNGMIVFSGSIHKIERSNYQHCKAIRIEVDSIPWFRRAQEVIDHRNAGEGGYCITLSGEYVFKVNGGCFLKKDPEQEIQKNTPVIEINRESFLKEDFEY